MGDDEMTEYPETEYEMEPSPGGLFSGKGAKKGKFKKN